MNKKVNHGIKYFASIGRKFDPHQHGKKLPRLKSSKNVVLFVKIRTKLSPTIKEKTRCNTLFKSPPILTDYGTGLMKPGLICSFELFL